MNMQVLDAGRDVSGGYKADVTRGERVGRVSSEWFSRPDDGRFLSLGELAAMVRAVPIIAGRALWRRPASMWRRAVPMPSGWRWCCPVRMHRRAEPLVLRPARGADRRAGRVSASASRRAGRHQSPIWPDLAPRAQPLTRLPLGFDQGRTRAVQKALPRQSEVHTA